MDTDTMWVKFIKYHSWGGKGAVIQVGGGVGRRLIASKYAVKVDAPKKSEEKAKPRTARKKPENKALGATS